MLLPLPFQAPALQVPAAPEPSYGEAEAQLLDRLDLGQDLPPAPALKGLDALAYRWLREAAAWKGGAPKNPFPAGSAAHQEAEALAAFVAKASHPAVDKLPLTLGGSRLLLWRWMKAERGPKALRRALEDRLLEPGPAVLRGWALRHALCFALAERDGARLGRLKEAYGAEAKALFFQFQALFALLDGPSPVFRMWRLPGLDYQDQGFGDLGSRRVWIAPAEAPAPQDAVWIIASATGYAGDRESQLRGAELQEAQGLAARMEKEGRKAWFASSAAEWELQGFAYFPILVELDRKGWIQAIRMGDAAPAKP